MALTWIALRPGLTGGFLFDDFANLEPLGRYGTVDDWATFWLYITSGFADPTGRPLSLLTFLLDARDWPADPAPFLRTNVLLHLINGGLLFALLRQLGQHLDGPTTRTEAAALLGAGLWLLHPLWVSTTLYVVQREAMLPATFVLLALMAYIHGRQLHADRPRAGAAWMLLGIGAGTLLGVLSKANGALLPLFALVLDATVLRVGDRDNGAALQRLRWWRRTLLVLPSLLLALYLLQRMPGLHADLFNRPWTIAERLLTQPRALMDYLQLLFVPRVLSTGLYNDGYAASTGLLAPPGTLVALLLVAGLAALGFGLRRRLPVVAAGILFYLAGHLLESTIVPLELYFEHRNYLPAMLLFWPIAWALAGWKAHPALRTMFAFGLLAMLAATTWQRATLWGQPEQLARLWVAQNPESGRALATASSVDARTGRPGAAMQRLLPVWRERPHDLQLALNYANTACAAGGLDAATLRAVEDAMLRARSRHQLLYGWFETALESASQGRCPGLDLVAVQRLADAALANPELKRRHRELQGIHSIAGRTALAMGDTEAAVIAFDRALETWPSPQAAGMQATFLAQHGHYRDAIDHIDHFRALGVDADARNARGMGRIHQWLLRRTGYWDTRLDTLRTQLELELISTGSTPS